jgi:uncharacterized membrane protein HdeD (DUF308 family)
LAGRVVVVVGAVVVVVAVVVVATNVVSGTVVAVVTGCVVVVSSASEVHEITRVQMRKVARVRFIADLRSCAGRIPQPPSYGRWHHAAR